MQKVAKSACAFMAMMTHHRILQDGQAGKDLQILKCTGQAAPGQLVSSMTKAGIVNMTEGFAKELAPLGVRVNAVLPGLTDTKFASALTGNPKILEMMLRLIPLGRVARPDEIAPAVLFLASPASSYLTGAALPVDGGWTAQ